MTMADSFYVISAQYVGHGQRCARLYIYIAIYVYVTVFIFVHTCTWCFENCPSSCCQVKSFPTPLSMVTLSFLCLFCI